MLLLPFLPITALIIQNSTTLNELLQYQTEVQRIGDKVETATFLERFITNMQRERSEVAFHIFTNGTQTLGLNLTDRFKITDEAFEKMTWPNIKQSESTEMFKSKLRYQVLGHSLPVHLNLISRLIVTMIILRRFKEDTMKI